MNRGCPPFPWEVAPSRLLTAGSLSVFAARPTARPALAFLELLLGPANATLSGFVLLGIFDPADELVPSQGRDVLPGLECRWVGDQRLAQVSWKLVHHPTRHPGITHRTSTVAATARRVRRTMLRRLGSRPGWGADRLQFWLSSPSSWPRHTSQRRSAGVSAHSNRGLPYPTSIPQRVNARSVFEMCQSEDFPSSPRRWRNTPSGSISTATDQA